MRTLSHKDRPLRWTVLLGALGVSVALVGCGPNEEDAPFEPPAPKAIAFEGKIDPAYVGDWSTDSKLSQLTLEESGKASMVNVAPGRGKSESKGEWKLSDGHLLFKLEGAAEGMVTRYAAKLDGDRLHLTQKASKLEIDYKRVKK